MIRIRFLRIVPIYTTRNILKWRNKCQVEIFGIFFSWLGFKSQSGKPLRGVNSTRKSSMKCWIGYEWTFPQCLNENCKEMVAFISDLSPKDDRTGWMEEGAQETNPTNGISTFAFFIHSAFRTVLGEKEAPVMRPEARPWTPFYQSNTSASRIQGQKWRRRKNEIFALLFDRSFATSYSKSHFTERGHTLYLLHFCRSSASLYFNAFTVRCFQLWSSQICRGVLHGGKNGSFLSVTVNPNGTGRYLGKIFVSLK